MKCPNMRVELISDNNIISNFSSLLGRRALEHKRFNVKSINLEFPWENYSNGSVTIRIPTFGVKRIPFDLIKSLTAYD